MSLEKQLIEKLYKKSIKKMEDALRGGMINLAHAVGEDSPIDTSFFVSNWYAGEGSKPLSNDRKPDYGVQSEQDYIAIFGKAAFGKTYWHVNQTEYGPDLEYGYSPQAPRGIVRVNKMKWSTFVDQAIAGSGYAS